MVWNSEKFPGKAPILYRVFQEKKGAAKTAIPGRNQAIAFVIWLIVELVNKISVANTGNVTSGNKIPGTTIILPVFNAKEVKPVIVLVE